MDTLPDRPSPQEFASFLTAALDDDDPRTPAVVFDRDGTLASCDWVRPSDDGMSGWHRFNAGMPFDAVVPYTQDLLLAVPDGIVRFMFSGRAQGDKKGEDFRFWQMRAWIQKNHLPIDYLMMRVATDQRADSIVKNEFLDRVSPHFRIIAAVDDRPQVCDGVWRARNIPLVQVVDPGLPPMLFAG